MRRNVALANASARITSCPRCKAGREEDSTRSVEASEAVAAVLAARGADRVVLNARQDAEEAAIVAGAGAAGRITIATNMAGRGTDIKLPPIDRRQLVDHWKLRDVCGKAVDPDWEDQRIIDEAYRHLCIRRCGLKKDEAAEEEAMQWGKQTVMFPAWSKLDAKKKIAFHHDHDISCEVSYAPVEEGGVALPEGTPTLLQSFNITGIAKFAKEQEDKRRTTKRRPATRLAKVL